MDDVTRIYFEQGVTSVFAIALDWPGWCRRARSTDAALDALVAYRERYGRLVGVDLGPEAFDVLGVVPGSTTTDFGAPGAVWSDDEAGLDEATLARHLAVLERHWAFFDSLIASAPAILRKGPRGGGRDRDALREHVREAERHYAPKVGVRVAPRTPWEDQRAALLAAFTQGTRGGWPVPYAIRRIAWHVADHAWEIEDRAAPRDT